MERFKNVEVTHQEEVNKKVITYIQATGDQFFSSPETLVRPFRVNGKHIFVFHKPETTLSETDMKAYNETVSKLTTMPSLKSTLTKTNEEIGFEYEEKLTPLIVNILQRLNTIL